MNCCFVDAQEIEMPSWSGSMSGFALKVLEEIRRDNWEFSIMLCSDKIITELNAKYRNKNEPTDILSFTQDCQQDEENAVYLPGDIVISLDSMRENTKYFAVNEDEELRRLVIHGILHLDGMDHETLDEKEPMLILQEKILGSLNDEHILPENGVKK
jgi:probable rRNA maturation factor